MVTGPDGVCFVVAQHKPAHPSQKKMSSKKVSKFAHNSASSDKGAHVTSVQTPYGRIKRTTHYNAKGLRDELDEALADARKRRTSQVVSLVCFEVY